MPRPATARVERERGGAIIDDDDRDRGHARASAEAGGEAAARDGARAMRDAIAVAADEAPALPWTTPPTALGSALCSWCGRDIHAPALPCSVAPVDGLAEMITSPGMGERCQWELRTRGTVAMMMVGGLDAGRLSGDAPRGASWPPEACIVASRELREQADSAVDETIGTQSVVARFERARASMSEEMPDD